MKHMLFTGFVVILAVFAIRAQNVLTEDSNSEDEPRKPNDCYSSYKNWIKKDGAYIATPEEKEAFGKLKTRLERHLFIENFWRRRDPEPDTEENEFRDEYYKRIIYANENFESEIPGWKTDRGRIHIVWGKADKVEKGYATFEENVNVPYETWFYAHLEGVGSGVEITFIDPTETGEFLIFKPKTEPDSR